MWLLTVVAHFFFNDTATTEIYTLSLHDALPISRRASRTTSASAPSRSTSACPGGWACGGSGRNSATTSRSRTSRRSGRRSRSEEHTSELQSPCNLVCRLLLEKKTQRCDPHTVST